MENKVDALRRVWCISYEDEKPRMDGRPARVFMGEFQTHAQAYEALKVVESRSVPKKNLRMEARWVSEWEEV